MGANIKNALTDPGIMGEIASGSKVYYIDGGHSNIKDVEASGLELREIAFNQTIKNNTFKIYEIRV